MPAPTRTQVADLRGAARLAVDATTGITDIVEQMHRTIQRVPGPLGRTEVGSTRGITGFVYRSVRGVTQLVGRGIDASLAPVVALLPEGVSSPARDAFLSAVNGVYGDHLVRTRNPLAVEMRLRYRGEPIDLDRPAAAFDAHGGAAVTDRLLVMVHGLCLNDRHWLREGHDHGAALAADLGFTPVYLHYNTGLHVAANGRGFAALLEQLVDHWPHRVRELVIVGHSMGGLVARSACHQGLAAGMGWPRRLTRLVFIGTPHHGAPLERGGQKLDFVLELSPYSAPFTRIGRQRSAGITDLRHGSILPGAHRVVPLPRGIRCYAAAATLGARRGVVAERLLGDGLVPLDSALGRHRDPAQTLAIPKSRQWVGYEMGHLELLNRPEVYAQLRDWLAA